MSEKDLFKEKLEVFGDVEIFNEQEASFEIKITNGFDNNPRNCHDLITIINAFYGYKFKFVSKIEARKEHFHYILS